MTVPLIYHLHRGIPVTDLADPRLSAWQNFYVIVGSSGAALIGVQFVVIALIAGMRRRSRADTIDAFATPTVVHLAGAFLVSAIMSAPWTSLFPVAVALATSGLGGLVYSVIVIRRARRQTDYRPVWEDWLWHAAIPCSAYAAVALAALLLSRSTQAATFVVGAGALGMLLVGIHNAWDSVTHIVVVRAAHEDATAIGTPQSEPGVKDPSKAQG